jgi:hypothetical protein
MKPRRRLTDAERQEAITLYESGQSSIVIGQKLGTCPSTITRLVAKSGGLVRTQTAHLEKTTAEQRDLMVADYVAGRSIKDLTELYGLDRSTILAHLHRRGVDVRPQCEEIRTYRLDESAFDVITEEAAYWIGFLMADGCVSDHHAILANATEKDAGHLQAFLDFLKSDKPVKKLAPQNHPDGWNTAQQYGVAVNSKRLCDALARYGVVPRKSKTARAADCLVDSRDFWRGVTDGDGYLFMMKPGTRRQMLAVGIVGSRDINDQFCAFAKRHVQTIRSEVRPLNSIWGFRACHWQGLALAHVLYKDCAVALPRKLQAYKEARGHYAGLEKNKDWSHITAEELLGLHAELGSWAAVARAIGNPQSNLQSIRKILGIYK